MSFFTNINVKNSEDRLPLCLTMKGNHIDCDVALVCAGDNPIVPYMTRIKYLKAPKMRKMILSDF